MHFGHAVLRSEILYSDGHTLYSDFTGGTRYIARGIQKRGQNRKTFWETPGKRTTKHREPLPSPQGPQHKVDGESWCHNFHKQPLFLCTSKKGQCVPSLSAMRDEYGGAPAIRGDKPYPTGEKKYNGIAGKIRPRRHQSHPGRTIVEPVLFSEVHPLTTTALTRAIGAQDRSEENYYILRQVLSPAMTTTTTTTVN